MEVDNETQSAVDYAIADQEFMSLVPAVFRHFLATSSSGMFSSSLHDCPPFVFISGDTLAHEGVVSYSLDIAAFMCSLPDGRSRKGVMRVDLAGIFGNPGSTGRISISDFEAGGWRYKCDSLVFGAIGSTGSYTGFTVKIYNGTCEQNGVKIKYEADRTQAVYSTAGTSGSGYSTFYGDVSGVSRTGVGYYVEVDYDIRKANNCSFFQAGKVMVTPDGFKARSVDFGDGTCDDEATFTVNENTVAFKLK
jgi:hypothetical protein